MAHCKSTEKKAHHTDETKQKMIHRMKRIEGQIRGIANMIEQDIYCDDIIHQFMAVESAIKGVKTSLLEAHMKSCVINQIQNNQLAVVDELMVTIRKILK